MDEKIAQVLQSVAAGTAATNEVGKKTDALTTKIDALAEKVDEQAKVIKELEDENQTLRTEVAALKERQARGRPKAEIKVAGIPVKFQSSLSELTIGIFSKLGIAKETADIHDIRLLNQRPPRSTQAGDTHSRTSDQAQNISYIIQFKSFCVRDKVLATKRKYGALKISTIFATDVDSNIEMYEMLSPYAHNLRLAAKTRARAKGYKYTWTREDNVLVRKDENWEIINVVTDSDLEQII